MENFNLYTEIKKLLADTYTPVQLYLRLRDYYPNTLLLESTDFQTHSDAWSVIALQPMAGIEVKNKERIEYKFPHSPSVVAHTKDVKKILKTFYNAFKPSQIEYAIPFLQGLFGYTSYDFFLYYHGIQSQFDLDKEPSSIPLLRYRLYKYLIVFNHYKDELYVAENKINDEPSTINDLLQKIYHTPAEESHSLNLQQKISNLTDEEYKKNVSHGINHCKRGDVFQIVLSRRYSLDFQGDDFDLYRQLRTINPSPYLFYFDYTDYKLFGSSPESQIIVKNKKAIIHPIAGTYKRTGNDIIDAQLTESLIKDEKENAEHTMLVDLARNDLSMFSKNVSVTEYKQLKYYSHLIHMVSEVTGDIYEETNPFDILFKVSPAGTLSGAPKRKAMELIDKYEHNARSYYGGTLGYIGFNGDINHAIMIRSFLSKYSTLYFQAGAGIVVHSNITNETEEVENKLNALTYALSQAEKKL